MKTVYFLRHGETTGNVALIHQFPETPLSKRGLVQAEQAGEHFASLPVEVIIASPYNRAQQTAEAVRARKPEAPIEYSELFAELRRPRALWGMHWLKPYSLYTMMRIYKNAHKSHWRHSDEENLEEFHARARRALEFLADRPEQHILVVTHRGFMANLRERMKRDGMDTIAQYRRALWKNIFIPNCSYMTATWVPQGEGGETLDGTWTVSEGVTVPEGVQSRFGLG